MSVSRTRAVLVPCLFALAAGAALAAGQEYQPYSGQPGKDVVWVPTPYSLVEKMLDMARVTPQDYVIDLGSGDGRNVIAAAKRGARALGVEYNREMVALARRNAVQEGVADKARFAKLAAKFKALPPGTRIVTNGFPIDGLEAVETGFAEGECGAWCRAYLYVVR